MKVYCVDDNPLHRKKSKELVERACDVKNVKNCEIIECVNGREFLDSANGTSPALVMLDINMPELDGLSTLVKLRKLNKLTKIIMVSSESADAVLRFKSKERSAITDEKKLELLNKVVERIRANKEEEGKINSVLEACGNLGLDPVAIARHLGADEYIAKPYNVNDASHIVSNLISAASLFH